MTRNSLIRSVLFFVLLLALGSGCANRSHDAAVSSASPAEGPGSITSGKRDRAITVSTTLTVHEVEASTKKLREAAERAGGYVADAHISGADDARTSNLDLRVPVPALPTFLATVAAAGETVSYTERAEDVTEQRADVKARLVNARAQEKRILELMSTKTSSLGETIEAEKELARIRETIERLDAQERAVDGSVALATVHVALQLRTTDAWRTPGQSIGHAAAAGVRGAAAFFVYLAMAVVAVAPTLLPIAFVVLAIVVIVRRRAQRKRLAVAALEN